MKRQVFRLFVLVLTGSAGACFAFGGNDPGAPTSGTDASSSDAQATDGGSDVRDDDGDAGARDAGDAGRCNPRAPFGPPADLPNITDAGTTVGARLSPDERTIYFSVVVPGSLFKLLSATRPDPSADFGAPSEVPGVRSSGDGYPSMTADGQFLYSARLLPNNTYDLFVATRDGGGDFSGFAAVEALNSAGHEIHPYVLPDHRAIYFASNRPSGYYDLYSAVRSDGGFAPPTTVVGSQINATDVQDTLPVVTPNELSLYFASRREGGKGDYDIYMSRRASLGEGFGVPTNLSSVNTAQVDFPTDITADECVLYLTHAPAGGPAKVYVAKRGH